LLASTHIAQDTSASGKVLGQVSQGLPYIQDVTDSNLNSGMMSPVGGSQPHTNFQPYLCVNYIISLFGIFPPPS
jgi:microcystin-dependent protein